MRWTLWALAAVLFAELARFLAEEVRRRRTEDHEAFPPDPKRRARLGAAQLAERGRAQYRRGAGLLARVDAALAALLGAVLYQTLARGGGGLLEARGVLFCLALALGPAQLAFLIPATILAASFRQPRAVRGMLEASAPVFLASALCALWLVVAPRRAEAPAPAPAAPLQSPSGSAPAEPVRTPMESLFPARLPGALVIADEYHGMGWLGLSQSVLGAGFREGFIGRAGDLESLPPAEVLVVGFDAFLPTHDFSDADVEAVEAFVRRGGGLLCAGQAWSWKSYGRRQNGDFPLNRLGKALGFRVADFAIGDPAAFDTPLTAGAPIGKAEDWAPSEIDFDAPGAEPMVRDAQGRVIAGRFRYGQGRVVVIGHLKMARDNPRLVSNALRWLAGEEAARSPATVSP